MASSVPKLPTSESLDGESPKPGTLYYITLYTVAENYVMPFAKLLEAALWLRPLDPDDSPLAS